jgi:SAM-dependent methyltransferase
MPVVTNDTSRPGFFPATAMPDAEWWQTLWPEPKKVLARIGIRANMEVVDLCCGDGLFTAPLALMCRNVIGIDLDPGMLALTRSRVNAVGATNCELIAGDAYAVAELVGRPVDCVLVANTFHGVPDKARIARGVAAVLKPGGRLAIINWHPLPREQTTVLGQPRGPRTDMRMDPAEVGAAVEPAGLKLLDVIELPPYHYGAVFARTSSRSDQPSGGHQPSTFSMSG